MPRLQGLIFDLDGTLIDSAPDLQHAINQTLSEQHRRTLEIDELKTFLGDGMLTMLQRAFAATGEALGPDDAYRLFQNFVAHYRNQKADMEQIYPHAREMLESFLRDGVKLGLCTNKQEAATIRLLDELDLTRYFAFIAGGDTFMAHKPHPDHVKGVAEKMQIPLNACVMIGDSTNDVLAAKGAGIPCLVVTHGYALDATTLGADALIDNLSDLRAAITRLGY